MEGINTVLLHLAAGAGFLIGYYTFKGVKKPSSSTRTIYILSGLLNIAVGFLIINDFVVPAGGIGLILGTQIGYHPSEY